MNLGIFIPTLKRNYNQIESALWIRALQMVPVLRGMGIEVSVNNPFKRYDAVIYHRGMRRRSVEFIRYLRLISRRVYWDSCVDYFDRHEAADDEQIECARLIASLVNGVCVPTETIAESARRYLDNVFVMPDPVNLTHFSQFKTAINLDAPVFGWSGVACKAKFLKPYADILDSHSIIVSEQRPDLPFRYDFVRWDYESFPDVLLRCDVAFLPRTLESAYTSNNSSFKALVYAALGIPIIATRLPSYELLANYYGAITFLEDYGNSVKMTLAALKNKDRDTLCVRSEYGREHQAQRLVEWLRG